VALLHVLLRRVEKRWGVTAQPAALGEVQPLRLTEVAEGLYITARTG
jgi:hypothetical protein